MKKLSIDLTEMELFRILDAIGTYKKDYSVPSSVSKIISKLEEKIKKALEENR